MNFKEFLLLCWYDKWFAALAAINIYLIVCFSMSLMEKKNHEND